MMSSQPNAAYTLRVKNPDALDFEGDHATLTLIVTGYGDGVEANADNCTVTVHVLNANDPPTADAATLSIGENAPVNTTIGRPLNVTDGDANDVHSWSIVFGDDEAFGIDETTGQLSVAGPLDFEENPVYTLLVRVADSGTPTLADTAFITIQVRDENDAPEWVWPSKDRSEVAYVEEGLEASNDTIGTVLSATDEDGDPLTYSIVSAGDCDGKFAILGDSLIVNEALIYPDPETLPIVKKVVDGVPVRAVPSVPFLP
jgi:hypothetical protein